MIETALKEDLLLDKKLIIPKNKLDAIRIMNELHPVVGGQPTHEKDQPNDNNPILDLACTLANIHASGVGEHADLRPIQNEPPSFFYGEGFISGISSLKGNGILAIFGHWRDGSGNYAVKQFYYTEKEISYRNAVSEDKWGVWIDVLTSNSQLDYNKLLNVPITSTLSDDKNKIASIFSVNEVNRKANTAQTTANNADSKAMNAQRTADTGIANAKIADDKAVKAQARADAAFTRVKPIAEGGTGAITVANARLNLGLKGAALADLTSTLSDAKDIAASIFAVNDVNRKTVTAQTTANNADAKAVTAQRTANEKVSRDAHGERVGNQFTISSADQFSSLIIHNKGGNQSNFGSSVWLEKEEGRKFLDIKFRGTPYVSGLQDVFSIRSLTGTAALTNELFATDRTYVGRDSNSVGVKYYNNRTYPIVVTIGLIDTGAGLKGSLRVNNNAVFDINYPLGNNNGNNMGTLIGIVPPGGFYEVVHMGTKTVTSAWRELI